MAREKIARPPGRASAVGALSAPKSTGGGSLSERRRRLSLLVVVRWSALISVDVKADHFPRMIADRLYVSCKGHVPDLTIARGMTKVSHAIFPDQKSLMADEHGKAGPVGANDIHDRALGKRFQSALNL